MSKSPHLPSGETPAHASPDPSDRLTRREAIATGLLAAAALATPTRIPDSGRAALPGPARTARSGGQGPTVVVVGAGVFGGWTALALQRAGARVTLLDAWGAGNARASSGGETRVIRTVYDGNAEYTALAQQSFVRWREAEARWGRSILRRTGALYMFSGDDAFARRSVPVLAAAGIPLERLAPDEARRRWPQVRFDGLTQVYFEPEAGVLLARAACELVREEFVRIGGRWGLASVAPGDIEAGAMRAVRASDGTRYEADAFVFACGPWLGGLFPDAVGSGIRVTRQDVVFFGTPAGDRRFEDAECPVWVELGDRLLYGIPGNERRGFKVADDSAGPEVDPTTLDRRLGAEAVDRARALLVRRFPALAEAPVVEGRVCQYERSATGDFLLDRHPGARNVWLAGGGSGHGFKMGPMVGELIARQVVHGAAAEARFSYARFDQARRALGARREEA